MIHERYTTPVSKTFYIETFGCQMNAHDSEKVIGTLEHEGYTRVQDETDAGLILYNTCSIRDKAEQKVFHRLNEYKRLQGEGKKFAVIGCVAQQEGEAIFDKAPYVSIVAGSASYRNLPDMLARLEAGETRITGLDDRQTDLTFETEFTARSNPNRTMRQDYITIIEGCDKFLRLLLSSPTPAARAAPAPPPPSSSKPRKMADLGFTEIQFLDQNASTPGGPTPSNKLSFAELLTAVGNITGIKRVRFTTSHPRDFTRDIVQAIDATPTLCDHIHLPVQSGSTAVLKTAHGPRSTPATGTSNTHELDPRRHPRHQHHQRHDRRLPRRDRRRLRADHHPARRSPLRRRLRLQVLPPPQHPRRPHARQHPRRRQDRTPPHPHGPPARDPA